MHIFTRLFAWLDRRKKDVDVDLLGFSVARARMNWADVRHVEVGRQPTGHVEIFFVDLWDGFDARIIVDDLMPSFETFRNAFLERWPHVADVWTRIFTGPPDVAERVTLLDRRT